MAKARSRANRLNARKSTGPKTAQGKQRSAQNARRHGLSLPVTLDPEFSESVPRLASIIAGEGASPRRLEAARLIAEPQIELVRLRRARLMLLNDPLARTEQPTVREKLQAMTRLLDSPSDRLVAAQVKDIGDRESGQGAPPLEIGLDILAPKLIRLDRYERRALSRRKKAIRAFDLTHSPARVNAKKSEIISSQKLAGEKPS